jgi:hypothetical protein
MYPPFGASWQMAIRSCVTFPSPSLKFRTAGFPQYGFKPVVDGNLRLLKAYMPPKFFPASLTVAQTGNRRTVSALRRGPSKLTGPEALGSASGFSVPSRHRLLWPHPSLCPASTGLLFFVRRTLCGAESPNFYLPVLVSVPSALPRRIGWWAVVQMPPAIAFDIS